MFLEVLHLDVQLLVGSHHPGTLAGSPAGKQTGMCGGTAGILGGNEAHDDKGLAVHCGAELATRGVLAEEMLGHWHDEAALLMA